MPVSSRQRTIQAQSIPTIPSVTQIHNESADQVQPATPSTATISPQSKHAFSPPAITQSSPNLAKLPSSPNQPSHFREETLQTHYSPPAPIHATSPTNIQPARPVRPPQTTGWSHPLQKQVHSDDQNHDDKHHRNGSTDQLGLRSFEAAVFEKSPVRSTEERRESPALPVRLTTEDASDVSEHDLRHQHSPTSAATTTPEQ
ncbi:hypothetical protein K503DRAFT_802575 [Rhizopogon vinicolor AM-OR11-026]|uniref:Uncharacterized protein n=1 Tax=Rhizopogon vinicolor AM-OR11-026 TaxID=1314800 RepID=A0A1B7MT21_9AGAM|nr:hypothetical protein K503DRAFT_802575 [Rhizopogon vinicolor AM-OR11-026]